ncbi:MAG TPA: LPS export ABC transporter periplasmic protein LptC, partial [Candidatus Aquilonibacter sp.]
MKRIAVVLLVAVALIAASPSPRPSPSPAAQAHPTGSPTGLPSPDTFQVGVWTVHASQLDVNFKTGDFSTPQRMTMTRDGGDITADRASGNFKTKQATLYGNVI